MSDGTVVSAVDPHVLNNWSSDDENFNIFEEILMGRIDVSDWRDIIAISSGTGHVVGLKADGTVVAAGWNTHGQRIVSNWFDIIAVSAGDGHTVGLKSDGTVVVAGANPCSMRVVESWSDIRLPG